MFKFPEVAHIKFDGINLNLREAVERAFNCIKEAAKAVQQIMQLAREVESILRNEQNRQHHPLDLTRAKIEHQVLCRKPRHLIKKII